MIGKKLTICLLITFLVAAILPYSPLIAETETVVTPSVEPAPEPETAETAPGDPAAVDTGQEPDPETVVAAPDPETASPAQETAVRQPVVVVDGKTLTLDVPPQIVNGRLLVPLRAIFTELGAEIVWDGDTQTVFAAKGNTLVVLTIGSDSPLVNGVVVKIDQPGVIVDGRTLVPLRFVAQAFGCTVDWDGDTQTATILSQNNATFPGGPPYTQFADEEAEIAAIRLTIENFIRDYRNCCDMSVVVSGGKLDFSPITQYLYNPDNEIFLLGELYDQYDESAEALNVFQQLRKAILDAGFMTEKELDADALFNPAVWKNVLTIDLEILDIELITDESAVVTVSLLMEADFSEFENSTILKFLSILSNESIDFSMLNSSVYDEGPIIMIKDAATGKWYILG